tara:strand:+ start:340 stop:882 length:543 start_codon:yes stop_codon:yes gene_type:complete
MTESTKKKKNPFKRAHNRLNLLINPVKRTIWMAKGMASLNKKARAKFKKKSQTDRDELLENIKKSKDVINKYKTKDNLSAENERLLKTAKENLNNSKKPSNSSSISKKTSKTSSTSKKRMTAREKLRAKNVERFGQKHVDHLRAKHADFKKMKKKEISKAAFIDKYPKSQTAKRSKKSRR